MPGKRPKTSAQPAAYRVVSGRADTKTQVLKKLKPSAHWGILA